MSYQIGDPMDWHSTVAPLTVGPWAAPTTYQPAPVRPYLCPLCRGAGRLRHGFIGHPDGSTEEDLRDCHACHGRGIVIC